LGSWAVNWDDEKPMRKQMTFTDAAVFNGLIENEKKHGRKPSIHSALGFPDSFRCQLQLVAGPKADGKDLFVWGA